MPKTFSTAKKQSYINHNGLKVVIDAISPLTFIRISDHKYPKKATHQFSIEFIEKSIAYLKMTRTDIEIIFTIDLETGGLRINEQVFFQLLSLINDRSKLEEFAMKVFTQF